ncbi:hypothetical protein F5146DRAFT_1119945 [Armillaria mellea]|nr:hypothetical protein F5146DRAFT_1119945 [Armillaria mellea]
MTLALILWLWGHNMMSWACLLGRRHVTIISARTRWENRRSGSVTATRTMPLLLALTMVFSRREPAGTEHWKLRWRSFVMGDKYQEMARREMVGEGKKGAMMGQNEVGAFLGPDSGGGSAHDDDDASRQILSGSRQTANEVHHFTPPANENGHVLGRQAFNINLMRADCGR